MMKAGKRKPLRRRMGKGKTKQNPAEAARENRLQQIEEHFEELFGLLEYIQEDLSTITKYTSGDMKRALTATVKLRKAMQNL